MLRYSFFKKDSTNKMSNIVDAKGPSADEQLLAMVNGDYWVVLNANLLRDCKESVFCYRANALKIALQTYGPASEKLPSILVNEGKAKNQVYHGHVNDANGTTYVLEWAIIDPAKKIMALIGFGTHENYKFQQEKLTDNEIKKIINKESNQKILARAEIKIQEAKTKINKMKERGEIVMESSESTKMTRRK